MRTVLTAAVVLALAGPATAQAPAVAAKIDHEIVARSQAWPALAQLTSTIGPRMTGSAKGAQAEAWALAKFKAFGYAAARFEPFQTVAWERGPLTLTIAGEALPAVALGYSPTTDLSTELADMGNGRAEDYAAAPDKAKGKIALVYMLNLPGTPKGTPYIGRGEKIALAKANGAVAVVVISYLEGRILSTGSAAGIGETEAPLPAVLVTYEDGMALKAKAGQAPLTASLRMTNRIGPATARNVVATLPGSDLAAEHIVFGAHLDSWDLATGALDNGSGTVTVLEVARAMKASGYRPRRSIDFVLYMGEEEGMHGSRAHARGLAERGELKAVRYMFNSDMSLDPTGLNTWGFDVDKPFYEVLIAQIRRVVPTFAGGMVSRPMPGGDSDPYQREGVPILYLEGDLRPEIGRCQHADCDRLDIVSKPAIDRTARVSAQVLEALADADRLPAEVLSGEALEAYRKANNL